MKDWREDFLRKGRPDLSAEQTIGHCLKYLFADTTHNVTDEVVHGLTFEELIGALLQAEDLARDSAN